MKVIKVITSEGLGNQEYGAIIEDNWYSGDHRECVRAVKEDLLFDLKCEEDSGAKLYFIDGVTFDKDGYNGDGDHIKDFINNKISPDVFKVVKRLQSDDMYNTVYEVTYQIFE